MSNSILLINSVVNTGSTGHIVEDLGQKILQENFKSYIAYGRKNNSSNLQTIKIGNKLSIAIHFFLTRFFDFHGLGSYFTTKKFLHKINKNLPNIIHLHNIHGYFINYKLLFKWINKNQIPVVWTLHDCWSFTGHCAYYISSKCIKWETNCINCPNKLSYPKTFLFSNSKKNYLTKKRYFTLPQNMVIVTPSMWLNNEVKKSFLSKYQTITINNGIDLSVFKPYKIHQNNEFIILGVANIWDERKGLNDFIQLSSLLHENEKIVLIGIKENQKKLIPQGIKCLERTENQKELAMYYSKAIAFLNLTYEDNFPTTNLESLACGTPIITYNTGGSPESIDSDTGFIVNQGDLNCIRSSLDLIEKNGKEYYIEKCYQRAKILFDKENCYKQYISLYKTILHTI